MTTAVFILATLLIGTMIAGLIAILYLSRKLAAAEHAVEQADQTLCSWAEILAQTLAEGNREFDLANRVAMLGKQAFQADGAIVFGPSPEEDESTLPVWGLAGTCRTWFPHVNPEQQPNSPRYEPPQLTMAMDLQHQFFWSTDPISFAGEAARQWFPENFRPGIANALVTPIALSGGERGLLAIIRSAADQPFERVEQSTLAAVTKLIEARFRIISLKDRIDELEQQVQQAHEEGMLQIASGITHNIGNAVTVIQMALEQLQADQLASSAELARFMDEELLPALSAELPADAADLISSLGDINTSLKKHLSEATENAGGLAEKFEDVVAVIALQQRFIGELGTENVVTIAQIIHQVEIACKPVLDQRDIPLNLQLDSTSRVLVDPAMIQHVILLLLKYAIESIAATMRSDTSIDIATWNETMDDRDWVVVEIHDKGVKLPPSMDEQDAERQVDQRTRDFRFCRQRIEKYGGRFAVSSRVTQGTSVRLQLPRYRE